MMPSYGTIAGTPATELQAIAPHVWINSKLYPYAQVLKLQKTKGATPSECTIMLNMSQTEDSPVTLNRYLSTSENDDQLGPMQFGSRIVIVVGATILFSGHLLRRQDSGSDDTVILTAVDERDMLANIPVRGALVYKEQMAVTLERRCSSGHKSV